MNSHQKAARRPRDRDGLHKRRGIWHYWLQIDGKWRERSTSTRVYKEAKTIRQKALQAQQEGKLPTDSARAKLSVVAPLWLAERERLVAAKTLRIDRERLKPLLKALGHKALRDITSEDVRAYQLRRSEQVSNRTVNLETKVLRGILKRHKLWARIADDYKPLKENGRGPGKALSDEEEKRLFDVASGRPSWQVAYCAGLLAANTTARGVELRNLQLEDVDLEAGVIYVQRSKTDAGQRVIPLNGASKWAVARLLERAQSLGAEEPGHYLFPACERQQIDVTRHQKSWRTAWRNLTKAAGLKGLRFHDLRHHAITKLAEAGVPEQTMMAIAGHIRPEMIKHYSHIRQKAAQEAVAKIDSYRPGVVEETVGSGSPSASIQ